jgi:WD40 repeat protein
VGGKATWPACTTILSSSGTSFRACACEPSKATPLKVQPLHRFLCVCMRLGVRLTSCPLSYIPLVNALQPLKGGRQLASGSEDKSIRIWDVTTGQCLRYTDRSLHHGVPGAMVAHATRRLCVCVVMYSVLQRRMGMYRSPVLSLTALPNGHLVAGAENNKITVWDVDTGARRIAHGARHYQT